MSNQLIRVSQGLHARVREFAVRCLRGGASDEFEALACDIAAYQTGKAVRSLTEVLRCGVVSDCFRLTRVFRFHPEQAQLRFVTSGTTSANSGVHYMRERETYERLSLLWGKAGLGFRDDEPPPIVIALAPWTGRTTSSSLGYMMQRFMEHFDGRSLTSSRDARGFVLDAPERWLVSPSGIDVEALRRVRELAIELERRVVLLATSFALVELVDRVGGETFALPPGSVIMPTGGFKGRSRAIEPAAMHAELDRLFGPVDVIGEYGMTELTSQLYQIVEHSDRTRSSGSVYLAPPWLRVLALDPTTLEPVASGEVGLSCFVDLGNVDSAVCVVTQDLVRVERDGAWGGNRVELLGRQTKAPLRGCSLAVEALLSPEVVPVEGDRAVAQADTLGTRPAPAKTPATVVAQSETDSALRRVTMLVAKASELTARLSSSPEEMAALSRSSGLSVEGVRLALELSLESGATRADAITLVETSRRAYAATQGVVWVLLSSTVFCAPLRAIAVGAALSSRVKVRPSRREPHFTKLLHDVASDLFDVVTELAPAPGDSVLAYGSDETLQRVRASLPAGVHFFGHGHGMGVAVIGAGSASGEAASALALDVILFDQQGCLSPRLVLIDAANDVDAFASQLAVALAVAEQRVPVGHSHRQQAHESAWSERLASNLGRVIKAGAGWLGCFDVNWAHRHSVPIPPPCRCLSVVSTTSVEVDLAALRGQITTVGIAADAELTARVTECLPGARIVNLGAMQRPAFDGPVDRRHLAR